MFLKNFYKYLAYGIAQESTILTTVNGTEDLRLPSLQYLQLYSSGASYLNMRLVCNTNVASTACNGVIFGNGSTPPTIEDFALSGKQITSFTYSLASLSTNVLGDGAVERTGIYTITNTGTEDFTISEIGLVTCPANNTKKTVLFERTLLETPVTIQAGGVGQVTYTIRVNDPTA